MELWSRRVKDELNNWAAPYKRVGLPATLSFSAAYGGASVLTSGVTFLKFAKPVSNARKDMFYKHIDTA